MQHTSSPRRPAAFALAALLAGTAVIGLSPAEAAPKKHHAPAARAPRPPMSEMGRLAGVAQVPVGMQRPTREVLLSIGEGELITLPVGADSVWIANPAVADVYVNSARQLHLFGKQNGETTVFASRGNGEVIFAAQVRVSQNITSLDRVLRAALPESTIKVTMVGQYALLTGTVATPEDAAQAAQLVKVSLNPGAKASGSDDGLRIGIINRLRTAIPLQVNLQVRIAEVSRSLLKTLNSNLSLITGAGGFKFGVAQGRVAGSYITGDPNLPFGVGNSVSGYTLDPLTGKLTLSPGTTVTPAGGLTTLSALTSIFGRSILGTLDAGETLGLVTTLAQPNLTAVSGESAEFLAGGEFPIPMSQGLGTVSIEYKKYGVSLSYTPTVLSDGRISLHVRPEVSELSSQGSITLNGFTVPALTTRRTETTVELGSGQSFMIAGLLSNHSQNAIQKTPLAGDVPVLGPLFKSTTFQRGESELVIVITPFLVNPVDEHDIKLPTDGLQAPNDIQRVFGNMMTDGDDKLKRPEPSASNGPASTPKVGLLDLVKPPAADINAAAAAAAAAAPTPAPKPRQAAADASAPGFSLN